MGDIFNAPITGTTTIWEDNQSAIAYSQNTLVSEKMKHVGVKCHFLKGHVELGTIMLRHLPLTKWWLACSPNHYQDLHFQDIEVQSCEEHIHFNASSRIYLQGEYCK
jgi:hypothetical protein